MKSFKAFIKESIIDPVQPTLSKQIFDKTDTPDPVMKKRVKGFIMRGLGDLEDIARVDDIQVIGSILTRQFAPDADVDVNVLFRPFGDKEAVHKRLRTRAAKINGAKVPGTQHPVNFFALVDRKDFDKATKLADAAYDLENDTWIKKAKVQPFDPDKYVKQYGESATKIDLLKNELKSDIADFSRLEQLSSKELKDLSAKVTAKVQELEDGIKDILEFYKEKLKLRKDIFTKPLTPEELKQYGSKNAMPENVIYKLFERFMFWELANKLKEIIGDDDKLSKPEARELKKVKVPDDAKGRLEKMKK